jgi:ABC-type multidrug transport system fused ATPase/permease subunit
VNGPGNVDGLVGTQSTFEGGQKQRLALARAILVLSLSKGWPTRAS